MIELLRSMGFLEIPCRGELSYFVDVYAEIVDSFVTSPCPLHWFIIGELS